ncbi:hypothetical protein QN277_005244 [Acacia crassicarpa]|uniref:F-box domain-containing protein n=1 Tax=Acacia crassicarpa TaxID=499986 RepID=A0AAE1IXT8_9FABA|nr:hypothetical protein QN277_005244 [Acacia crassicarpa]
MEQTVINGAAPYLSEEITINILKRLPVKSLIRLQCVCKHWENLFKTPFFIAAHLCQSHQNPSFIFSHDYLLNNLPLRLLDYEMHLRDVQKAPQFDFLASASCVGSSNGLLCFVIRVGSRFPISLLVWNPVTGDGREVPISRNVDMDEDDYVLGFGFSPLDNDYKIMAIYSKYGFVSGVDIYSLSRGSWKEIESRNLENVSCYWRTIYSNNGAIFTYGIKNIEDEEVEMIVSFDMGKEVFTLIMISWPPLWRNLNFSLAVYEDKPAIITTSVVRGSSSNVDLWVMEEDTSSWSWIKKFTSGPHPWVFKPGIIWRNEIVVSGFEIGGKTEKHEQCLCLFNITTNELKTLEIRHCFRDFVNYVESFVLI